MHQNGLSSLSALSYLPPLNKLSRIDLDDCFVYRDIGYREEFDLSISGAYDIDCPDSVQLARGEKTDVVTCIVSGIDSTNLGSQASEITITLSGFAYEDTIPSTTIWLEP